MIHSSRSDFIFNVRELAQTLRAEDIKALNEGLGLGEIKKAQKNNKPTVQPPSDKQPLARANDLTHLPEQDGIKRPIKRPIEAGASSRARSRLPNALYYARMLSFRAGIHTIDLLFTFSILTSLLLFLRRVAQFQQPHLFSKLDNISDTVMNLPIAEGLFVVLILVYLGYFAFWISFRLAGVKTPGHLLLVKTPK